jgi:hypothetical protein
MYRTTNRPAIGNGKADQVTKRYKLSPYFSNAYMGLRIVKHENSKSNSKFKL